MFLTFRRRLLFWFLVFISSSLIIIALSVAYLQQRENIVKTNNLIEAAYLSLLTKEIAQKNFLSYDSKSGDFFERGESAFLEKDQVLTDSTLSLLASAKASIGKRANGIDVEVGILERRVEQIDSVFEIIVEKIKQRGYKDFMLVGQMRADAHWLEEITEIPDEDILRLRRHEKDYIIRNETRYVDEFNSELKQVKTQLDRQKNLAASRREEVLSYLNGYQRKFAQLVNLDQELGVKDNSALRLELDERIRTVERGFDQLVTSARARKQIMFNRLNLIFIALAIILPLLSVWMSYVISNRITKPLTDLTIYITRFVDSNFTLKEANPKVRSKDEIGKLTQNFSILKEEITSQLQFFKEKVEERTQELASANERLRHINESNQRFVPQKFIHFLGKNSIEEVKLGDNVQQEMTLMFADIRKFTQISESLSPQENFDFINDYLSHIVPIIQKNEGIIDKFIGDSVMTLFPNGSDDALRTILEFEEVLKGFNAKLVDMGRAPIKIGTGIHTGPMILGTIGHKERLQTTVISDAVNIASRVEGLTKFYKANTILTEDAIKNLPAKHSFHYRFLDFVKVKGKTKAISVFELISPDDPRLAYQSDYNSAVVFMRNKQIAEAADIFNQLYTKNPADETVKVILDRCNHYLEYGLPEGWDGVEEMEEK